MSAAAERFRALHADGEPVLVLPNAWDAGSARLVERAGAAAVATSSAGVAWAHGYPDGDVLPVPLLLATLREIVRVVAVPVSADIESGFSDDLDAVEETIRGVVEAGVVGINIEDGGGSPSLLCAKIERARRVGGRLFINARTDVYWKGLGPAEGRVEETLARAAMYREAGADGLFVPAVTSGDAIRAIVAGVGLPLNVLASPALPSLAELGAWGVRRLSAGSGIVRALYGHGLGLAEAFLRDGRLDGFEGVVPMAYAEANRMMGGE